METIFKWKPNLGSQLSEKPRVTVTQYGDGYEARTKFLINNNPKSWELTFTNSLETHNEILKFLREHEATDAFEWTDPAGEKAVYVAREWTSRQVSLGIYEIQVTFDQVFE